MHLQFANCGLHKLRNSAYLRRVMDRAEARDNARGRREGKKTRSARGARPGVGYLVQFEQLSFKLARNICEVVVWHQAAKAD